MNNTMTVSYTHLDVYKRQEYGPRVTTLLVPPHKIGKNVREIEYLRDNNYKITEKSDIRFQKYK